jgi:hypothetical protein
MSDREVSSTLSKCPNIDIIAKATSGSAVIGLELNGSEEGVTSILPKVSLIL